MHNSRFDLRAMQPCSDLHETPRISSRHQRRVGVLNVFQLWFQNSRRRVWLEKIVDPCSATAVVRICEGHELQAWNRGEHLERWRADALGMEQMAWRIVGDCQVKRPAFDGSRRR